MMICSHQRNAVATALVLVLAAAATAMQPQLTLVSPWGLERGKTHEITLLGNRIKDAQELLFYSDGFQVDSLKAVDNKTCKVTVAVSPECRLGLHAVRLRTATGISSLCLFNVGAMAHVEEMEPNSDFAAPQAIPHNRTVAGVILAEDEDYFVLEAKKGQRISAELMGLRLGHTFFDPHLAILNEERFELAASDDTPFAYQDCVVALVAPEDGKYILRVRESSYGGDESSRYLLHVGEFLRPLAIYPAGGRPGERLAVRWLGDAAGPRDDTIPLPSDVRPDGVAQLFAQDDRSIAPTGNRIRLVDLPNVLEAEPNDARREATPATIPAALNGIIGQPGDTDHFRFSAKKGEKYHIRVFAREPVRSPLDAVINVFRANGGGRVGGNDDTGGPDAYLQFNPPADDDYFLRISDHLAAGGPGYVYRIEVSRRVPELSLSLPEKEQSKEVTLSVPRGNRMALMVSAKRDNFDAPLGLDIEGLPPGLSSKSIPLAEDRVEVPVLFTADEAANPAGSLASLTASSLDEELRVAGSLRQRTQLVGGQNNRDMWGHDAFRMAAAITEKVPFSVQIVEPKVPIVRNGSMKLKVQADRSDRFDGEIKLAMLYNPPGIGSSANVRIPAGKTEAEIPMTANGNAAINTWPIVVLAASPYGGATAEVASEFADLQVADAFFDIKLSKAAAEQGQTAQMGVSLEKKADFHGTAKAFLVGLPAGTTSSEMAVTGETTQLSFPISIEPKARPGKFTSVMCRLVIEQHGEQITQTIGGGELRIDKPLEKKKAAPAKPQTKPKAPKKNEPKPLSRLEQLRQQAEQ